MLKHYDWSLLIVLDCCRYDYFARFNTVPGILDRFISPAAGTIEWVQSCFPDLYPEITYISANPYIASYPNKVHSYRGSDHFGEIVDAWNFGWDEKLQTVPPHKVTEAALSYSKSRKVIAHYIQPHSPYIGNPSFPESSLAYARIENLGRGTLLRLPNIRDVIRAGEKERLIQAYIGNVKLVLAEAAKLANSWHGKVVITADHGEAFGEQGVYAHGVRIPETTNVPWLEVRDHG